MLHGAFRQTQLRTENCRDLLRKLEREIERFTAARDDVEARIDHAFNIVVAATWFADLTLTQKAKPQIFRPNAFGRGHHASLAFQLTTL